MRGLAAMRAAQPAIASVNQKVMMRGRRRSSVSNSAPDLARSLCCTF
jgi:hypothetical protein